MEKDIKFTGPFKNRISFDKSEILKKISVTTFRQARRHGNIYDALLREFYEEACLTSAKYFRILVDKECLLYENASIRERISDEQKLLLSLFDNCKMAEKVALSNQCNGPETCTRLLLQCILILENRGKKYDWILMDVYRITIKIATKVCQAEEVSKESLCQIYYKFAIYQQKSDLAEAVKYLAQAFDLARCTNWVYKVEKQIYNFTSLIAKTYASTLINYANNIFPNAAENAINQAQKALIILTGEGIEHNRSLYIKVNLDMADFQLKAGNGEKSISLLAHIVQYITPFLQVDKAYLKFLARYNHLNGNCLKGEKKYDMALVELYKSLNIKRNLNMKHEEGVLLLDIAKTYIERGNSQFSMAESCLRQSKDIFVALNDMVNTKKTSYIMANLKMQRIRPMILDFIKHFPFNYCDKYRLIYWKSICQPFWRNLPLTLAIEEQNPLVCILKPNEHEYDD